ncbi:MAG: L,D-transpeptidase family protein [Beijerinckiaceae bacterium]|nr:L,D-transpeptidase family protein [Beijerinckiaceae bacterium]
MRLGGLNIRLLLLAGLSLPALAQAAPALADEINQNESAVPALIEDASKTPAALEVIAARPVALSPARQADDAAAQAIQDQLPLIEPAPLSLNIDASIPSETAAGVETDETTTAALKRGAARGGAGGELPSALASAPSATTALPEPAGESPPPPALFASSEGAAAKPVASEPALAAESPTFASATPGGEVAGPELPDAEIARAILRKLSLRKGKLDEAIAQFYEGRANRPLWIEKDGLKPQVTGGLATLAQASDHGLKPESYAVAVKLDTLEARAETEIDLTRAMLKYARDARGARINPRKISPLITAEPTLPDTAEALAKLSTAADLGEALESFQPQQAGYKALQHKLAELLRTADGGQAAARLEADIVANMERWRWMPLSLGNAYVMVNVPDYELKVIRDGRIVHQTKVIVGKPQTPTPIFSHAMEYLIVNPYWNIPPSIALKEMLPQLRSDPYALQRKGFEIIKGGKAVDPAGVDWTGSIRNVRIRQLPGERNALGFIKFMFPNDHSVYLHDTPSRGLFARSMRAFSHGCVRVFEPFALADILLDHQNGLNERQLRAMIGSGERYIYLQNKIPVHIAYFTTFMDDDGTLQSRPDVYGHNAKVKMALQAAE